MNGAHDMGGRLGFATVIAEPNEPVFHAAWEGRVFGIAGTMGAFDLWNLDEDRHACENILARDYVSISYYEIWLRMFEKLLIDKGVFSATELKDGAAHGRAVTAPRLGPADVWDAQVNSGTYERQALRLAKFAVGQHVRVRNLMTSAHTRLPGYLRGVHGEIVMVHGCHVFPDSNAKGEGENPQWLYAVRFTVQDVWGRTGKDLVHADLWEPYLEAL